MAARRRSWGKGGIELPVKLLISAIILGISIPVTMSYWSAYDLQQTRSDLERELELLAAQIQGVYDSGEGNSRVVEVNIRDGTFARISYVEIGGEPGSGFAARSVRWRIGDGQEQAKPIGEGIPVSSTEGGAFRLPHGISRLYIETNAKDGLLYVEINRA